MTTTHPEFPKINGLYKRGEKGKIIPDEFSRPEFEYLRDLAWVWTEKVDGTNIRLGWDPSDASDEAVTYIGGRTDRAQIPPDLLARLTELQETMPWHESFPDVDVPVTLYGEGYGARIQKGGGNYIPDGVDFVLFDVRWYKMNGCPVHRIATQNDLTTPRDSARRVTPGSGDQKMATPIESETGPTGSAPTPRNVASTPLGSPISAPTTESSQGTTPGSKQNKVGSVPSVANQKIDSGGADSHSPSPSIMTTTPEPSAASSVGTAMSPSTRLSPSTGGSTQPVPTCNCTSGWLSRENVLDVGSKLGLDVVPFIANCTIGTAEKWVRDDAFDSHWPGVERPEGLVGRPAVNLFTNGGGRITTKIKWKDYA